MVIENEPPPRFDEPPPRVYLSIHPEGTVGHVPISVRVLGLNDPSDRLREELEVMRKDVEKERNAAVAAAADAVG